MGRPKVKRKYNRKPSVGIKSIEPKLSPESRHLLEQLIDKDSRSKLEKIVNSFTLNNREPLLKEVRFGLEGIMLDKLKGFLEATSA